MATHAFLDDKDGYYQIELEPGQELPEWVKGLTPCPVVPPAPVPSVVPEQVTMRQARLALLEAGKLTAVNNAIAALPGAAGDEARVEWEFSSAVERHRPLVAALAGALNLSDSQLDALFVRAAEM